MYCPNCMEIIDDGTGKCPKCGMETNVSNAENALPIGTILANRYYVGVVLGQGGFGITYVGCDTKLNKKIAIKEYYPAGFVNRLSEHSTNISVSAGDAAVTYEREKQKFIKEAYLLAEFAGNRSIVNVTDIIVEHNTAYIIMEYVEGETLSKYIKHNGRMSFSEAYEMLKPLIGALSKIHSSGLIHRDISPDNIMVQSDGHVVLIDFGAAREFDSAEERSMSVILKQGYAPAEQYQSRGPQGPWTDVYALCATMYKMITGITPPSAIDRMVGDIMKKPSELGASIEASEESALLKGLAVFQADRYSSVNDLDTMLSGGKIITPMKPVESRGSDGATEYLTPDAGMKNNAVYTPTEIVTPTELEQINKLNTDNEAVSSRGEQSQSIPAKKKTAVKPLYIILGSVAVLVLIIVAVVSKRHRYDYSPYPDVSEAFEIEPITMESEEETEEPASVESEKADIVDTTEETTENESGKTGSVTPSKYSNPTANKNLTVLMYDSMLNTMGNAEYEGDMGKVFPDIYADLDLNGDGQTDTITRVRKSVVGDEGFLYLIEFSDGTKIETPAFTSYPDEGEIIQFCDTSNSNIDDILVTHIVDSSGGPVVTEAYYYFFTGKAWKRLELIDKFGEVTLAPLKEQLVDSGASEEDVVTFRDIELTENGLVFAMDHGHKNGAEQTTDIEAFLVGGSNDTFEVLDYGGLLVEEYWPEGLF